jgi:hypothetical protein
MSEKIMNLSSRRLEFKVILQHDITVLKVFDYRVVDKLQFSKLALNLWPPATWSATRECGRQSAQGISTKFEILTLQYFPHCIFFVERVQPSTLHDPMDLIILFIGSLFFAPLWTYTSAVGRFRQLIGKYRVGSSLFKQSNNWLRLWPRGCQNQPDWLVVWWVLSRNKAVFVQKAQATCGVVFLIA